MKNLFKSTALLFSIILLWSTTVHCQTYGQIFSKSDANQMFGTIIFSITLPASDLQGFLDKTENVLMFRIKDGNLEILGDERTPVSPPSLVVDSTEVFKVYSKSIMSELLTKGGSDKVSIEQRICVLTITYGDFTMEFAAECPPICP